MHTPTGYAAEYQPDHDPVEPELPTRLELVTEHAGMRMALCGLRLDADTLWNVLTGPTFGEGSLQVARDLVLRIVAELEARDG